MRTIFSFFREYTDAQAAVGELISAGYDPDEMNAIMQVEPVKNALSTLDWNAAKTGQKEAGEPGQVKGLDAMLVGRQPVRVAELGQVFTTGALATLLAKTAISPDDFGGPGLKDALIEFDVPDQQAESLAAGVKGGGLLFFIRTADDGAAEAARILREHNGQHIGGHSR